MNPQETQAAIEDKIGQELEEGVAYFDGYVDSVLGVTDDGRLAYSYEGLIEETARMFAEDKEITDEDWTSAQEWVDFNTIRSIPYMGDLRPVVIFTAG